MAKHGARTATPRLRFPEFSGRVVRHRQLDKLAAESTTRNYGQLPVTAVMGVSSSDGIVPMQEHLISADLQRYKVVHKNWFAYNPMRLNIGSIAQWKGDEPALVSPDYVVFKCIDGDENRLDPSYLDHFRQSETWERFVTEGGDGSVRVRIYFKDLARLRLPVPELAEQRRIADCLTSLDEVIAAQGRKVEALKAHKRGLMQQLFPREGETRPRLRFPEFRNASEWRENALKDICSVNPSSGELPDSFFYIDLESVEEGLLKAKSQIEKSSAPSRAQRLLRNGDVLFQTVRPYQRNNLYFAGDCAEPHVASTGYAQLRARDSAEFLYQIVHTDAFVEKVIAKCTGSNYPAINSTDLAGVVLFAPKDPAEQERIADCLISLDTRIYAEADRLTALKVHKQGLMQQLFPAPDAATA